MTLTVSKASQAPKKSAQDVWPVHFAHNQQPLLPECALSLSAILGHCAVGVHKRQNVMQGNTLLPTVAAISSQSAAHSHSLLHVRSRRPMQTHSRRHEALTQMQIHYSVRSAQERLGQSMHWILIVGDVFGDSHLGLLCEFQDQVRWVEKGVQPAGVAACLAWGPEPVSWWRPATARTWCSVLRCAETPSWPSAHPQLWNLQENNEYIYVLYIYIHIHEYIAVCKCIAISQYIHYCIDKYIYTYIYTLLTCKT